MAAENERLSNLVAQANSAGRQPENGELLRLRSEVGMLRRQTNEAGKLRQENSRLKEALASSAAAAAASPAANTAAEDPAVVQERATAIARMGDARTFVLAMTLFAGDHQGQAPASLDDVKSYLGEKPLTNAFEQVYSGPLQNLPDPSSIIVVREPEAHQLLNGKWGRAYGFADGHSELHVEADNNFGPWEQQHMAPPRAAQPGQ